MYDFNAALRGIFNENGAIFLKFFSDPKVTAMGQKGYFFRKIKIFWARHKIVVGHRFGLDFVVFFTLRESLSLPKGHPEKDGQK